MEVASVFSCRVTTLPPTTHRGLRYRASSPDGKAWHQVSRDYALSSEACALLAATALASDLGYDVATLKPVASEVFDRYGRPFRVVTFVRVLP